jgi:hypothetical protein
MAQFNLGWMYFNGTGVLQGYAQAFMWTNLAATQGLEKAVKELDSLINALTS